MRNCQTIFQSGCSNLHFHHQCLRVLNFPYPCQYLLLSVFLIYAILVDVKWYFIVVLIFISLMSNNVEYLFMWSISQGKNILHCFSVLRNIFHFFHSWYFSYFRKEVKNPVLFVQKWEFFITILNKMILVIHRGQLELHYLL